MLVPVGSVRWVMAALHNQPASVPINGLVGGLTAGLTEGR